ncbi:hypothetical protein U1Q18_028561 [Sarracenia purpurea var. burkii]
MSTAQFLAKDSDQPTSDPEKPSSVDRRALAPTFRENGRFEQHHPPEPPLSHHTQNPFEIEINYSKNLPDFLENQTGGRVVVESVAKDLDVILVQSGDY